MASRRRNTQQQGCFRSVLGFWGRMALYFQIGRIIINAIREYNTPDPVVTPTQRY